MACPNHGCRGKTPSSSLPIERKGNGFLCLKWFARHLSLRFEYLLIQVLVWAVVYETRCSPYLSFKKKRLVPEAMSTSRLDRYVGFSSRACPSPRVVPSWFSVLRRFSFSCSFLTSWAISGQRFDSFPHAPATAMMMIAKPQFTHAQRKRFIHLRRCVSLSRPNNTFEGCRTSAVPCRPSQLYVSRRDNS